MLKISSNNYAKTSLEREELNPELISYNPFNENNELKSKWNELPTRLIDAQNALNAGKYTEFVHTLSEISNLTKIISEKYDQAIQRNANTFKRD
jgi:hypothetical protein